MLRKTLAVLLAALSIALFGAAAADARGRGHGFHHGDGNSFSLDRILDELDLTDAQRAEIDAKLEELEAAGAAPDEIRAAVVELLEGFGVEVPDALKSKLEQQIAKLDLTDEQRAAVDAKIAELEAAGASEDEIRDALVDLLEELGVEVPAYLLGHIDRLLSQLDLTEDQIAEIDALVAQLRADGATQTEIQDAVLQKLEEWGVDVPDEVFVKRGHHGRGFGFFLFDLTEDQRLEILATVAELQVAGATHQEIRDAIKELLVEWGVIEGDGEAVEDEDDGDAAADLAMIDAQIQAAPDVSSSERRITSWGAIKAGR
jgi:Spy/CpxP family protein refolding chaperone